MCIQRPNPYESAAEERGGVFADYDFCEHGITVPDGKSEVDMCEDCREYWGSVQAEGSVGK